MIDGTNKIEINSVVGEIKDLSLLEKQNIDEVIDKVELLKILGLDENEIEDRTGLKIKEKLYFKHLGENKEGFIRQLENLLEIDDFENKKLLKLLSITAEDFIQNGFTTYEMEEIEETKNKKIGKIVIKIVSLEENELKNNKEIMELKENMNLLGYVEDEY